MDSMMHGESQRIDKIDEKTMQFWIKNMISKNLVLSKY